MGESRHCHEDFLLRFQELKEIVENALQCTISKVIRVQFDIKYCRLLFRRYLSFSFLFDFQDIANWLRLCMQSLDILLRSIFIYKSALFITWSTFSSLTCICIGINCIDPKKLQSSHCQWLSKILDELPRRFPSKFEGNSTIFVVKLAFRQELSVW